MIHLAAGLPVIGAIEAMPAARDVRWKKHRATGACRKS